MELDSTTGGMKTPGDRGVRIAGRTGGRHREIEGHEIKTVNDFDKTALETKSKPEIKVKSDIFTYVCPPHSFTMLKGKILLH